MGHDNRRVGCRLDRPDPETIHRFFGKVWLAPSGCWKWTGHTVSDGYGQFRAKVDGAWHMVYAHRMSYAIFNGCVPPGDTVDHMCTSPWCVNPSHLRLLPAGANTADANRRRGNRTSHTCPVDSETEETIGKMQAGAATRSAEATARALTGEPQASEEQDEDGEDKDRIPF